MVAGADTQKAARGIAGVGLACRTATSCVADTVARFGGIDILVNNAGTNPYFGPMIDIDLVRKRRSR